jgi:hypothetical protein
MGQTFKGDSMHDAVPVQIRFQLEELAAIDAYRRAQKNPPSRPQAVRDLLKSVLTGVGAAVRAEVRA